MKYRMFDAHTHAFPHRIAERSVGVVAGKANVPYYHAGDFDALCAYEAAGGADGFLLLPIATKPGSVRSINDWVAGKRGINGAVPFGTLHPDGADYEAQLNHLVDLGIRGIKLHPEYQAFFVDEARMMPIYEAVFGRGLIISFHAGVDLGYPPPVRGDPERMARVAEAFPEGRIIAAHMGAFDQLDRVIKYLAGRRNVWMDTSFAAQRMTGEAIVNLVRLHGADRFLFGTDAPWAKFEDAKGALLHSGLGEDELKAIFWDNAAALLGQLCGGDA